MTARPEPLTPESCDLRGLSYMPFFGHHLFASDSNAAATDGEFRARMTLTWSGWNQVPAGSLPNDDKALCLLAGLGRDVASWQALRAGALRGFVECSDGRLYHPFLCEQARVAWSTRVAARDRKAQWRAKKSTKKQAGDSPVPVTETGTERGRDGPVPAEAKQRDIAVLKDSNVALLRNAPKPTSAGTTGHGAERHAPPSLVAKPANETDKPKTKQPLGVEGASKAVAHKPSQEVIEKYEPVALKHGLGTFADAAARGVTWVDHVRSSLLAGHHAPPLGAGGAAPAR